MDEAPETAENPEDKAPTSESPEGVEAPAADAAPDPRDAEIAELRRQLEAAAPILQAHKAAEDARKTDAERAADRIAELESALAAAQLESARARVAEATGLPLAVVARLAGSTEDEIRAAADEVAKLAAGSRPKLSARSRPVVGGEPGKASSSDEDVVDPAKLAEAIRKRLPY